MENNLINERKDEINLLDVQIKDLKRKKRRQIHILVFLFGIILTVVALEAILETNAVPSTLFDGNTGFFGTGGTNNYVPTQQLDVRGHGNFSGNVYINNATLITAGSSGQDMTNVAFLNNTQSFTDNNIFSTNLRVDRNLTVNGNLTAGNTTIRTLTQASCDVKSTTSGNLYCGTDATGAGSGQDLTNIAFLNNTQSFTQENNFTLRINIQNANVTGNLSVQNLSIRDLKTCTLKTTNTGLIICGTDDSSSFNPLNIAYLNNTQTFTLEQNFSDKINIRGNLNATGNFTIKNLTITDLLTCTLKTTNNGMLYCGTDNTGTGQLDDIYNGTVKAIIGTGLVNVTSNDVTQNVTFTLLVTNESNKYLQINASTVVGLTNESGSLLQANESSFKILARVNESGSLAQANSSYFKQISLQNESTNLLQGNSSAFRKLAELNESQSLLNYIENTRAINQSGIFTFLNKVLNLFGIGTTTPSYVLHVKGNVSLGNDNIVINNNTNNVTINANTFVQNLTVYNNITAFGNITTLYVNNCIQLEQGNVSLCTNRTSFYINAWNMRDIWYRP